MKIPSNNQWTQLNNGDIAGILNETHNITFDKQGVLKLNQKSIVHSNDITGDGGDADFEQVQGIEVFGGNIYAITDDHVFKGDIDGTFLADTDSDDVGIDTASVVVYDRLYVVDTGGGTDTVDYYNGSSWTSGAITGLVTGFKHPMTVFESLPTYKLAIGDKNSVRTYDSSHGANTTVLILPAQYIITSLVYRNGYLYVGTKTDDGSEAAVFIWDGLTANANYSVPVGASWVLSMVPYMGTVAGLTNEGELFGISGNSKQQLGVLPIFHAVNKRWFTAVASVTSVVLHSGLTVLGDNIYMVIEGTIANNTFQYGMKDGVWCFDPKVGVYHCAAATVDVIVQDNGLALASDEITTSATHNLMTGDPVQFTDVNNLSGVVANVIYYAVVTAPTTLKLAGNRRDADLGNTLIINGTPDATDVLIYAQNTDFGSVMGGNAGAIKATNHRTVMEPLLSTDLVYGFEPVNLAGVVESTLQGFCDSFNRGWFTTQKIYSQNVTDSWQDLYVFLNGALTSNEEVIVKYRTEESIGLPTDPVSVTWTSTTSFNTTDQRLRNNVSVGDEILFTEKQGQGKLAHITAISHGNTVTEITIDEAYGVAAASSQVIVTGFKKTIPVSSLRENKSFVKVHIGQTSNWVQIKVELRGYGIEVAHMELTNAKNK